MNKFVKPSKKIEDMAKRQNVPVEMIEKRVERIMKVAGLSQANATSFILSILMKQKGARS